MSIHEQVWVKVNTEVDCGMAKIVTALTSIEGLRTLQSCEGRPGSEAYIYFWYGTWEQTSRLVFDGLIPELEKGGISATGAVEVFNGSLPTAKIGFDSAALIKATAVIECYVSTLLSCAHNSLSLRDTEYKVQAR